MSDDTKDHDGQINGLNNTVNILFQSYVQEIFLNKDSKSLKKARYRPTMYLWPHAVFDKFRISIRNRCVRPNTQHDISPPRFT